MAENEEWPPLVFGSFVQAPKRNRAAFPRRRKADESKRGSSRSAAATERLDLTDAAPNLSCPVEQLNSSELENNHGSESGQALTEQELAPDTPPVRLNAVLSESVPQAVVESGFHPFNPNPLTCVVDAWRKTYIDPRVPQRFVDTLHFPTPPLPPSAASSELKDLAMEVRGQSEEEMMKSLVEIAVSYIGRKRDLERARALPHDVQGACAQDVPTGNPSMDPNQSLPPQSQALDSSSLGNPPEGVPVQGSEMPPWLQFMLSDPSRLKSNQQHQPHQASSNSGSHFVMQPPNVQLPPQPGYFQHQMPLSYPPENHTAVNPHLPYPNGAHHVQQPQFHGPPVYVPSYPYQPPMPSAPPPDFPSSPTYGDQPTPQPSFRPVPLPRPRPRRALQLQPPPSHPRPTNGMRPRLKPGDFPPLPGHPMEQPGVYGAPPQCQPAGGSSHVVFCHYQPPPSNGYAYVQHYQPPPPKRRGGSSHRGRPSRR